MMRSSLERAISSFIACRIGSESWAQAVEAASNASERERRIGLESGPVQQRRAIDGVILLLDLDRGDQKRGGDRRHRNLAGLGATIAIEHGKLVGSCQDVGEACERSADDVDPPNEFVGIDAIDD